MEKSSVWGRCPFKWHKYRSRGTNCSGSAKYALPLMDLVMTHHLCYKTVLMHAEILQLPLNYPPYLYYTWRHGFCYLSGRHKCRQRTPSGYTAHIIRQE